MVLIIIVYFRIFYYSILNLILYENIKFNNSNGIKITPNDICRSKMNIVMVNLKIIVEQAVKIYIYIYIIIYILKNNYIIFINDFYIKIYNNKIKYFIKVKMFKQILFISLLIGYTFAISYKAYLPNYTKWSQRKLSSNGKYELKVYYWNDSMCYFTPSVTGKNEWPCCVKNGTGKLNVYRSQNMEGLKLASLP